MYKTFSEKHNTVVSQFSPKPEAAVHMVCWKPYFEPFYFLSPHPTLISLFLSLTTVTTLSSLTCYLPNLLSFPHSSAVSVPLYTPSPFIFHSGSVYTSFWLLSWISHLILNLVHWNFIVKNDIWLLCSETNKNLDQICSGFLPEKFSMWLQPLWPFHTKNPFLGWYVSPHRENMGVHMYSLYQESKSPSRRDWFTLEKREKWKGYYTGSQNIVVLFQISLRHVYTIVTSYRSLMRWEIWKPAQCSG